MKNWVSSNLLRLRVLAAALVIGGSIAACAPAGGSFGPPAESDAATPTSSTSTDVILPDTAPDAPVVGDEYRLGSGDNLRIIVYGEPDLTGEFQVAGNGFVSFPLIGQLKAANLTVDEFSKTISTALSKGYINDPRVSVEVLNYRPFYIIGEVQKPGEYPYTNGMTVLNAVAVAGGYTYRATTDSVYISRGGGPEQEFSITKEKIRILPGDIVRVPERYF
ncbi:MAG: polysaccharide export protein [Parvibaculaceae bacterium]|nr:polysaccharide export protein [Parvibaculaceae bacterium]